MSFNKVMVMVQRLTKHRVTLVLNVIISKLIVNTFLQKTTIIGKTNLIKIPVEPNFLKIKYSPL